MSYSERMRYIQEEANKVVSRNKVRDASEITLMRQAKASSVASPNIVPAITNLHTNQLMPPYQGQNDCTANVTYIGVGTKDTTALLAQKQNCAVCSDDDTSINPYIILPTPCYNRFDFPFIQKVSSATVSCGVPGFNHYFPPALPCCNPPAYKSYPSAN